MKQIMECRYCIKHELGHCPRFGGMKTTWKEPLFITLNDGRRFQLEFCCNNKPCTMKVYICDE